MRLKDLKLLKNLFLLIIFGLFSILGWLLHLFQIFQALLNDKSSKLGFTDNYGIVIVSYNFYGEMMWEIIAFVFIFIFMVICFVFLCKKEDKEAINKLKEDIWGNNQNE